MTATKLNRCDSRIYVMDATNLIVTRQNTADKCFVRAYGGFGAGSGKRYMEATMNHAGGGSIFSFGFGLCTKRATFSDINNDLNMIAISFYGGGWKIVGNGGTILSNAVGPNPTHPCIAVDLDNNLFWARPDPAGGSWNNNGSADPATGVGGIDYTAYLGGVLLWPMFYGVSSVPPDTQTALFASGSWSGTPPAGFGTEWAFGLPAQRCSVMAGMTTP